MKASDRKDCIKATLLNLMKMKPIDHIKVTDITDSMYASRMLFYSYYDSIYSVLQEIEEEFFNGLVLIMNESLRYPLDDRYFTVPYPAFIGTMQYYRKQSDVIGMLLLNENDSSYFWDKIEKFVLKWFIKHSAFFGMIDAHRELVYSFILAGSKEFLKQWFYKISESDDEEAAIILYRLNYGYFKTLESTII